MKKCAVLAILFLLSSLVAGAQDFPRVEAFAGYSYLRVDDLTVISGFQGGNASAAVNFDRHFGIEGEFGAYHNANFDIDTTQVTWLVGPKVAFRSAQKITPFVHALFGVDHDTVGGLGSQSSENAFAMALGGGLDAEIHRHISLRLIQVDYIRTTLSDLGFSRQNDLRISLGVVFRFGN